MKLTKRQRESVRAMFDGRCAYCGEQLGERWHADHFMPVQRELKWVKDKGLTTTSKVLRPEVDRIENMRPSCAPCNIDKGGFTLEQWRTSLQGACDNLRRYLPKYRHALRFGLVTETGAPVEFYFERSSTTAEAP